MKLRAAAWVWGMVAVSVAPLWPILFRAGLPAYQHDWSWPFSRDAVLLGAFNHFSTWDPAGLGRANALASDHVFNLLIALPALAVSATAAAKIVLAISVALAALSASILARKAFGLGPQAAAIAGVFYATTPVVVNKIGAGHVSYWLAYALFPLVLERAVSYGTAPKISKLAQLALLSAGCAVQLQFVAFCFFVTLAAAAAFANTKNRWPVLCASLAGGATVAVPSIASFFSAPAFTGMLYQAPRTIWESSSSAGFPDAFWMAKYVVPYYSVPAFSFVAFQIAVIAAVVAGTSTRGYRRLFLLLAIFGLAFATGTSGPLAFFWRWSYEHVAAATVFREAYNANALLALAYTVGLCALMSRKRWILPAATAIAVTLVPQIAGLYKSVAPNVTAMHLAAPAPHLFRTAALPLVSPVMLNGRGPGGVDVFQSAGLSDGGTLSEYPTLFPLTAVSLTRCGCESWFIAFMRRASVTSVFARQGMYSADARRQSVPEGTYLNALVRVDAPRPLLDFVRTAVPLPIDIRESYPADAAALSDPAGPLPQNSGDHAVIAPQFDRSVDDPKTAWVDANRWYALPVDPFASTASGVTTQSSANLDVAAPRGTWSILYSASNPVTIRAVKTMILPPAAIPRWAQVDASGVVRIQPEGGTTTIYRLARGQATVPVGRYSAVTATAVHIAAPWKVTIVTPAFSSRALLVFRERYSPHWRLSGARVLWHGVADGYANAFVIDRSAGRLTLAYDVQALFFGLSLACWFVQGSMIVLAVRRA